MKKVFLVFCLLLVFTTSLFARKTIFSDNRQQWEIVDIRSNNELTEIVCEVTFLSNRGGCMDAHTYDRKNSSIYIYGDFGRKNLLQSEFSGNYKPWQMYQGHYEWNYFKGGQKGKKATAVFYFSRIPASASSEHKLRPDCPPKFGRSASGLSFAIICSNLSTLSGSI